MNFVILRLLAITSFVNQSTQNIIQNHKRESSLEFETGQVAQFSELPQSYQDQFKKLEKYCPRRHHKTLLMKVRYKVAVQKQYQNESHLQLNKLTYFKMLDIDDDGYITEDEFSKRITQLSRFGNSVGLLEKPVTFKQMKNTTNFFNAIRDVNNDGKIGLCEFDKGWKSVQLSGQNFDKEFYSFLATVEDFHFKIFSERDIQYQHELFKTFLLDNVDTNNDHKFSLKEVQIFNLEDMNDQHPSLQNFIKNNGSIEEFTYFIKEYTDFLSNYTKVNGDFDITDDFDKFVMDSYLICRILLFVGGFIALIIIIPIIIPILAMIAILDSLFCLNSGELAIHCLQNNTFNQIPLGNLQRGDYVMSAYGICTKVVYTNKHQNMPDTIIPKYTKIHSGENFVSLTPGHNIIVNDSEISAEKVKIGDALIKNYPNSSKTFVDNIEFDQIGGRYISVYTQNGTILVNNIGVSSFSVDNVEVQRLMINQIDSLLMDIESKIGFTVKGADLERILSLITGSFDFDSELVKSWITENPGFTKYLFKIPGIF